MTAQILSSELASILYESKKKQTELRGAIERSTQDLKSLPQTSEAQLAADLRRKVHFASPFLLACGINNPKLALSGVTCIQRLVVTKGLAPERLQEGLNALQECSKINLDIQLKILQTLPSLLQNYGTQLEGELQAKTIELCTSLQQVKSAPVSSAASATLQQVLSSVFDKVEHEDAAGADAPIATQLELEEAKYPVRSAAHDAFRVLQDICHLLEGFKPTFAVGASLQQPFGLELIEAVLTNNGDLFDTHDELGYLLRTRIMSIVTRFLSERLGFGVTVRTTRILCIILREHLDIVQDECEIPLTLLNHLLDSDSSTPWRRALCMETFRIIYSAPNLIVDIYALFDQRDDKRNIVQESMAHFVRLASEKPALIGVGSQSSNPTAGHHARNLSQDQAILEANSVAGIISADTSEAEVAAPGISVKWSSMKTPCLEQLDKTDAPAIPDTYVYSLVLTCLNNLSEGAAKTVLPLTVPHHSLKSGSRSRGASMGAASVAQQSSSEQPRPAHEQQLSSAERLRVINPLELVDHSAHALVVSIAHMIDSCWPAILATSSTFLNAALDTDHYRGLIRSIQRFTQVAGLLRLATPRDAFLTTLTKSAVPAHLVKSDLQMPQTPALSSPRMASGGGGDSFFNLARTESSNPLKKTTPNDDGVSQVMSQRNLMCLRALINLAIALGSILDASWTIVIESLQKADNVLAQSSSVMAREYRSSAHSSERQSGDQGAAEPQQPSLTSEITAVEAAITRLFQSTADYPNEAFVHVLRALFELIGEGQPTSQTRTLHFALAKIGELVRINIKRLAVEEENWGWTYLTQHTRIVATTLDCDSTGRLMSAEIISNLAIGVSLATLGEEAEVRGRVQFRAIECLETEINTLYAELRAAELSPSGVDMDVHRSAVEAVRSILETCGDSLISGWRSTFSIVESAFVQLGNDVNDETHISLLPPKPVSTRIAKSAFACAQLICSDFLGSLKPTRVVFLIDIFSQFCFQTADVNLSLTTLTLFWNLSDFLQSKIHQSRSGDNGLQNGNNDGGDGMFNSATNEKLRSIAEGGSASAIWMVLLRQLAAVTRDGRGDVRTGAVQTVFRILNSSATNFDSKMWTFIVKDIILMMIGVNIQAYKAKPTKQQDQASLRALHVTSDSLLKSWAATLAAQSKQIISLASFEALWTIFLNDLAEYLDFRDDALGALTFDCLSQILAGLEDPTALGHRPLDAILSLWLRNRPSASTTARDEKDESPLVAEEALIAYIRALRHLYPLVKPRLKQAEVKAITECIQACVTAAQAQPYATDVDIMTVLQTQVLDCFAILWADMPNLQSTLVKQLAFFIELPYRTLQTTERGALSFVAFAKAATGALSNSFHSTPISPETYSSGALSTVLKALALALDQRYTHLKQGKAPHLWRVAASASVDVLSRTLPSIESQNLPNPVLDRIFHEVVQIANYLRETNLNLLPANETLIDDETFDVEILTQWRKWVGIRLASDDANYALQPQRQQQQQQQQQQRHSTLNDLAVSASIRERYVESLFLASLLHETNFSVPMDLVAGISKVRAGRVYEPAFHPRVRICYASLDELFAVANPQLNPGKTASPLASTASPYLTLRCALPLQRYISDQPLRGKMPTPTSQRLELLYVLGLMKDLKRDLKLLLLPLVNRATASARRDSEVAEALQDVIEAAFSVN